MSVNQALDALGPADRAAVEWLLESDEPAVRHLTLTEVLGLPADAPEVVEVRGQIVDGPIVRGLLAGQQADGGFGVDAYSKWNGAHWRLLALVELGVPADDRMLAAFEHELAWIRHPARIRRPGPVDGRFRRHGSQEGAALAAGVHLGLATDDRVAAIARDLVDWQWPDGGWNCDIRPAASHSSFHESIKPLWALDAYGRATGEPAAGKAADRAAEFFLFHRLFRSERTGEPYPRLLKAHFPTYWHYDFLDGLHVLAQAGRIDDPRTADALAELQAKRLPDGRWRAGGSWWRPPGSSGSNVETVDWGRSGPNPFVTLRALRVLKAAGRLVLDEPGMLVAASP
jgi:hypothetical protein